MDHVGLQRCDGLEETRNQNTKVSKEVGRDLKSGGLIVFLKLTVEGNYDLSAGRLAGCQRDW